MEHVSIFTFHILTPSKYKEYQIIIDRYWKRLAQSAAEGITEDALSEDEGMAKTIATFRYVKCNYTKHAKAEEFLYETLSQGLCFPSLLDYNKSWFFLNPLSPGLANRTAEKTKPSALDMMLLFKESVRINQSAPQRRKSALRDVLFGCIADYNKSVGNHREPCL